MQYHIDDLKDEDIPQCLEIYNYYIRNTTITLEEDELTLESFMERCHLIQMKFPYITIKDETDKVLGYCYLDYFNTRSAYRISADLSIYVDKDHLHEHLGKLMLEEIEKRAIKRNIYNLVSLITSENENSIFFHERNGFIHDGEVKDIAIKMNRLLSCHFYRKQLKKITISKKSEGDMQ